MHTSARDADDAGSASRLRGADALRDAGVDLADVERVLGGDVNAFEGIVRRWQGPLVNMAWRYCRDRGRAEEMAQEAWCAPGVGWRSGDAREAFRHGCLRWRLTCFVQS